MAGSSNKTYDLKHVSKNAQACVGNKDTYIKISEPTQDDLNYMADNGYVLMYMMQYGNLQDGVSFDGYFQETLEITVDEETWTHSGPKTEGHSKYLTTLTDDEIREMCDHLHESLSEHFIPGYHITSDKIRKIVMDWLESITPKGER